MRTNGKKLLSRPRRRDAGTLSGARRFEEMLTTGDQRAVAFEIFAPQARTVYAAGSFNQWNTQLFRLSKDERGQWRGTLRLAPGLYQYRFVVDGQWMDDPRARVTVPNDFGTRNAVVEIK